jgi:hypothetical protein
MTPHPSPREAVGDATGEAALIAAILRQILRDAQSPHAQIRAQVAAWLADGDALRFWGDVVGLESEVLRASVQQALARAARPA